MKTIKALILALAVTSAMADSRTPADIEALSPADLETAFWDCDFASTKDMLGLGDAANCSFVFERVKATKFNNDFKQFMKWWADNKKTQHALRSGKVAS